jgi:glycogen debranching enzyme
MDNDELKKSYDIVILKKAQEIAVNSLKKCYASHGIYAGRKHFDDYWARDSFYACWGALEIDDFDIVKKNIESFLYYAKYNGQLPLRVGTTPFGQVLKFIGIDIKKEVPNYFQDKLGSYPQDQNSLFIITFKKYVEKTNDLQFLTEKFDMLRLIINWYESQKKDGMIFGGKYATWQDAVKKEGWTLYNNILYYQALICMDYLSKKINLNKDKYDIMAKELKKKINELFWNEDYYSDWINTGVHDYFSLDGNTLAVLFDFANVEKKKLIAQKIIETKISVPFGSKTNYPKYKAKETFLPFYLVHMNDYQNNGVHWLWLGCLSAITLYKAGMEKEAREALVEIAKVIHKHDIVSEVYNSKGNPIKRLFYRSEQPFAWSSSFFILACKTIK